MRPIQSYFAGAGATTPNNSIVGGVSGVPVEEPPRPERVPRTSSLPAARAIKLSGGTPTSDNTITSPGLAVGSNSSNFIVPQAPDKEKERGVITDLKKQLEGLKQAKENLENKLQRTEIDLQSQQSMCETLQDRGDKLVKNLEEVYRSMAVL